MNRIALQSWATGIALLLAGTARAESQGNLRLEIVTAPPAVAADFHRLNKQALLYHPIEKTSGKCPLLILLHGSGGSKKDILSFKKTRYAKKFYQPENRRYGTKLMILQSAGEWDPNSLDKMLDYILNSNQDIDVNRIYCLGYSMGGKGTWTWAMKSPKRFAAIVPMGFIPDLGKIDAMVDLPIWAMVGTEDQKARSEGIPEMEKALKELGSTVVRTTIFPGANHASAAGKASAQEGLFEWLFSNSRTQ